LLDRQAAEESQLDDRAPLARIVAHATHSRHPSEFTIAPVGAISKLLAQLDWQADDVDLFEINEAFASVVLSWAKTVGADLDKVNPNGGAIALGHPTGSSGARILVTLINALQMRGLKRGLASLCIGGGEATAMVIELV